MVLEAYEEEVLFSMYDNQIIRMNYTSVQKVASKIRWHEIASKHRIRKSFQSVVRHLHSKGYIDDNGKSGNVASLSQLGVDYVVGKLHKS